MSCSAAFWFRGDLKKDFREAEGEVTAEQGLVLADCLRAASPPRTPDAGERRCLSPLLHPPPYWLLMPAEAL